MAMMPDASQSTCPCTRHKASASARKTQIKSRIMREMNEVGLGMSIGKVKRGGVAGKDEFV